MTAKCPTCAACGMPMVKNEDFALARTSSVYCQFCTDEFGHLLPFDEIVARSANFYRESHGLTERAAAAMARDLIGHQPAWQEKVL